MTKVICPHCKEEKDRYVDKWQIKYLQDKHKQEPFEIPCSVCYLKYEAWADDKLDRISKIVMNKLYKDK